MSSEKVIDVMTKTIAVWVEDNAAGMIAAGAIHSLEAAGYVVESANTIARLEAALRAVEREKAEAFKAGMKRAAGIGPILGAASATLDIAKASGMDSVDVPHEKMQYEHLVWMRQQMESFDVPKASRWLGWMQASVVAFGFATFEQMKEANRKYVG